MQTARALVAGLGATLVTLAGCASTGVNQGPLGSDGGAVPPGPGRSLVVGGRVLGGDSDDPLQGRNDDILGVRPSGVSLYYGPQGQLLFPDGTPVLFKGVTQQLQDLRTQQRIR